MKKEELLKLYIENWEKSSDFLDKAILTLSTSTLWLISLSNIKNEIDSDCFFILWVWLMFITLVVVLLSYVIAIYNAGLWISYLQGKKNKKILCNIDYCNKVINYSRYIYVSTAIFWILFLLISII